MKLRTTHNTQLFSNCSSIPQNENEFEDTLSIFQMHCIILISVLLSSIGEVARELFGKR